MSRDYPHPPQRLWRALTDSALLERWLMPNDFEPRLGHTFTFRTEPGPGFDGIVHCEILELVPLQKLVFSWRGGPIDTVLTWEIEETATGCRLHIEQRGFEGIRAVLVSLFLERGSRKLYGMLLPQTLDELSRAA